MNRNFYHLLLVNVLWTWFLMILIFCVYVLHGNHWSLISAKKNYVLLIKTGEVLIPFNKNKQNDKESSISEASSLIDQSGLAILVTNLGLDVQLLDIAMKLPTAVALGFSPYADNLREILLEAKEANHQILINIPLKFLDPLKDAGPLAMIPVYDELNFLLKEYGDLVNGIYTDPKEQISKDAGMLEIMLNKIGPKNLLMCYSGENNAINELAKASQVPIIRPYMVISNLLDKDLSIKFHDVEKQLQKNRKILLSITASIANLSALSNWLSGLGNDVAFVTAKKMAEY